MSQSENRKNKLSPAPVDAPLPYLDSDTSVASLGPLHSNADYDVPVAYVRQKKMGYNELRLYASSTSTDLFAPLRSPGLTPSRSPSHRRSSRETKASYKKLLDVIVSGDEVPDDSPIAEVRANVSNTDDPTIPVFTFRVFVLGVLFCTTGASLNVFFNVCAGLIS